MGEFRDTCQIEYKMLMECVHRTNEGVFCALIVCFLDEWVEESLPRGNEEIIVLPLVEIGAEELRRGNQEEVFHRSSQH